MSILLGKKIWLYGVKRDQVVLVISMTLISYQQSVAFSLH
jgi:hypothetical protein